MRVRAQSGFPDTAQQLTECWIASDIRMEHKGVNKEPDQSLQLSSHAVCDGRSNGQTLLTRISKQEDTEPGEQRHERRGPMADAYLLNASREFRVDDERQ